MRDEREKKYIIKIMNERGSSITTGLIAMKESIRKYHKQLYANKLSNLDEMD